MKLRITTILILLLALTLNADAQRKKGGAKKPAKTSVKKAAKKEKGKKQPAKKGKQAAAPKTKVVVKDTSDLKSATIEIVQSYKPEVKQAVKPELHADLPPVDTSLVAMNYDVPPQSLYYSYNALPLRPLALGRDTVTEKLINYVKLGGGNLSTILLDAGITSWKGRNFYTVFNVRHLSQAGSLKYQKSSMTGADADGYIKGENLLWHVGVGVQYNKFYQYGYDHTVLNYNADQIGRKFFGINATIDAQNRDDDKAFGYHPYINLRTYNMNTAIGSNTSEYNVTAKFPFTYTVDTALKLGIALNGAFSKMNNSLSNSDQPNNYVQLAPTIDFKKGLFATRIGLSPTVGANNVLYVLPDMNVSFRLIRKSQMLFSLGWDGKLRQNTFEQLSTINPYMTVSKGVAQTHTDEIYGSLQTNVGRHITVSGRVSYWQYGNMPLFINDTAYDNKQLNVLYDKVNAVSLQGALRYSIGQTLSVGGSIIYTTYNADVNRYVWHEPSLKLNADLSVRPIPQLLVTGYLTVMNGMYALDKGNRTVTLPTVFDLGAGAEYSFMPRLSAFAQVNNIFNNQYERWYGYQAYGFNIFGGVRLKF